MIWANEPWGRYWGFGWRRTKSAGLSLIEFAAVLFTFAIVMGTLWLLGALAFVGELVGIEYRWLKSPIGIGE